MNALAEIINYILSSLLSVFALLVMLRFVLQWVRADFYNPLSQGIVKITNPPLKPLRRIIPGFGGFDIAALTLAFLTHFLIVLTNILLKGINPLAFMHLMPIIAALKVVCSLVNIAGAAMIISIILSWVAPMSVNPTAIIINQIAQPIIAPFRKLLPDMGGIDISPIFAFLALNVVAMLIAIIAAQLGIPVKQVWMFLFI